MTSRLYGSGGKVISVVVDGKGHFEGEISYRQGQVLGRDKVMAVWIF
jgi:uncharacterized protein YbcC (UPF0753/DUF2309 family)